MNCSLSLQAEALLTALLHLYDSDIYRSLDSREQYEIERRVVHKLQQDADLASSKHDPLIALPFEVQIRILQWLSPSDLARSCRVSRRWKQHCEDSILWVRLFLARHWSVDWRYLKEHSESSEIYSAFCGYVVPNTDPSTVKQAGSWNKCINWKYLYKKRAAVERRWALGANSVTFYPSIGQRASSKTERIQHTLPLFLQTDTALQHTQVELDIFQIQQGLDWAAPQIFADIQHDVVVGSPPDSTILDMALLVEQVTPNNHVYAVRFNSQYIVSGSRDTSVKVYDIKTQNLVATLTGHQKSVTGLVIDDRENIVVSGDQAGLLIVWDLKTFSPKSALKANQGGIMGVGLTKSVIVTVGRDNLVHVYSRDSNPLVLRKALAGHQSVINCVDVYEGTDGEVYAVTGSADRTVRLWNLDSGECLRTISDHSRGIATVAFDGRTVVSGGSGKYLHFYDIYSGQTRIIDQAHQRLIRTIKLHNNRLVTGSHDGTVVVWDNEEGAYGYQSGWKVHTKFNLSSIVLDLQFDYRKIIVSGGDNRITCIDMGAGVEGLDELDLIYK
ncbi:WD40-repeat-containing domain protein [Lipomyces oligophaga]|uniref:WD40-repeat-containing domain protein n=1 Tax=Lipomyces oligophaga TaxID=45792 RepID=UPI0034CD7E1F